MLQQLPPCITFNTTIRTLVDVRVRAGAPRARPGTRSTTRAFPSIHQSYQQQQRTANSTSQRSTVHMCMVYLQGHRGGKDAACECYARPIQRRNGASLTACRRTAVR